MCCERNDALSLDVEVQLHDCHDYIDLVAADTDCHKFCHSKFILHTAQAEMSKDS